LVSESEALRNISFFRTFHQNRPHATSAAFSNNYNADGENSYSIALTGTDQLSKGFKVFDVGCGDGILVNALIQKHGDDFSYTGFDICPSAFPQERNQNIQFYECNNRFETDTNRYDYIVSHLSLPFIGAPEKILPKLIRISNKNTIFSITLGRGSSDGDSYSKFQSLVRNEMKTSTIAPPFTIDPVYLSDKELKSIFNSHGLEIISYRNDETQIGNPTEFMANTYDWPLLNDTFQRKLRELTLGSLALPFGYKTLNILLKHYD